MTFEPVPDDIDALKTALAADRAARRQAEARASGAEATVAHLKLLIARIKRDRFGRSAERGRQLLDQLELQLEELEASRRGSGRISSCHFDVAAHFGEIAPVVEPPQLLQAVVIDPGLRRGGLLRVETPCTYISDIPAETRVSCVLVVIDDTP